MAVCKIILESRAFCKDELDLIIKKLLEQSLPEHTTHINKIIKNMKKKFVIILLIVPFLCGTGCKKTNKNEMRTIVIEGKTFIDMNKDGKLSVADVTALQIHISQNN